LEESQQQQQQQQQEAAALAAAGEEVVGLDAVCRGDLLKVGCGTSIGAPGVSGSVLFGT
jgi:hypothetical protein